MSPRFALPAAIAAVLLALAGGFLVGRASDSDDSTAATTTGKSPGDLEADQASKIAGHIDASEVVRVFPPQIIKDGDVAAEKKGSPERAFLEWWQAFQFHDVAAVEALTSQEARDAIGDDSLAQIVQTLGLQGVEILGSSESGDTASVEAGLLTFQPSAPNKPPPNKPTNSVPDTFLMKKEHGDWLFDDTEFLQLKVNAIQG